MEQHASVCDLVAFFTAMRDWEHHACELLNASRHKPLDVGPLIADRASIIAQFCTPKNRVSSKPFSCGDPPEYDPENESIIEVLEETMKRVVIHAQQRSGFGERRRYVMIFSDSRWLLDSWQTFDEGKWRRGII